MKVLLFFAGFGVGHMRDTKTKGVLTNWLLASLLLTWLESGSDHCQKSHYQQFRMGLLYGHFKIFYFLEIWFEKSCENKIIKNA